MSILNKRFAVGMIFIVMIALWTTGVMAADESVDDWATRRIKRCQSSTIDNWIEFI